MELNLDKFLLVFKILFRWVHFNKELFMKKILTCFLLAQCLTLSQTSSKITNADPLSETPLHPVPEEMTFEEYEDMNRRLSQALLWSSIPLPGITHYYAGEKRMAKHLFYVGMGGLACIIGGSLSMSESTWPDYDENIHIIHNEGTENERRYERVPVSMEGDIIHYNLKEIYKQNNGSGSGLIALGFAVLVCDFIFDRLKGLHLIEKKRNKVRYKYGQQLKFTHNPSFYFSNNLNGLGMELTLNLF